MINPAAAVNNQFLNYSSNLNNTLPHLIRAFPPLPTAHLSNYSFIHWTLLLNLIWFVTAHPGECLNSLKFSQSKWWWSTKPLMIAVYTEGGCIPFHQSVSFKRISQHFRLVSVVLTLLILLCIPYVYHEHTITHSHSGNPLNYLNRYKMTHKFRTNY